MGSHVRSGGYTEHLPTGQIFYYSNHTCRYPSCPFSPAISVFTSKQKASKRVLIEMAFSLIFCRRYSCDPSEPSRTCASSSDSASASQMALVNLSSVVMLPHPQW